MKIKKVEPVSIVYYDLFKLLKGLESERKGIKDRVWKWLCDEKDIQFSPIHGRILNMNLYFYGLGDEYPSNQITEETIEHSKSCFPEAFVEGTLECELRKDFTLIVSAYDPIDIEVFPVITDW
jgi:hypothetical protein